MKDGNSNSRKVPLKFQLFFKRWTALASYTRRNEEMCRVETTRIMNRISEIKIRHPELSKYLNEMPEFHQTTHSKIMLTDLVNYSNSLFNLLDKYERESKRVSDSSKS